MNQIVYEDILELLHRCEDVHKLQNHTVLITGATGFVGSFLIHTLITDAVLSETRIKIHAVVRNEKKARELFGEYIEHGYLSLEIQDIREPLQLDFAVDYIIHCASNAAPREYIMDPVGTILANCIGTSNILKYAAEYSVERVLYLSTIEVYGALESENPFFESQYGVIACEDIRSCYPLSKKLCENLCIAYEDQFHVPVVIGRLCYLYGPGMRQTDSKVVAEFTRNVAAGKNLILKSPGMQKRSYCYLSDAAAGLFTLLIKGTPGAVYNIASEKNTTTIVNIAQTLTKCFPEKQLSVLFEEPAKLDRKQFSRIQNAVLDNQKLKNLGWESYVELTEGLARTVRSISYSNTDMRL